MVNADEKPPKNLPPLLKMDQQDDLSGNGYMQEVYQWAYISPKNIRRLDQNWVVNALLFFQAQRLFNVYLNQIQKGSRVWQVAHVYGNLTCRAADAVGSMGTFHLTDITPIQIALGRKKLAYRSWVKTICIDAAKFSAEEPYDLVCSFFLLHEVPDDKKYAIVNNILNQLSPNGKALFVDYHRPAWWNPIGLILRLINAWLEPFSKALWHHEIKHYATRATSFRWTKKTLLGGVYQWVMAENIKK